MLLLGSASGIVVFIYGMMVMRPAGMRMGAISQQIQAGGAPPTPEQQAEIGKLRQTLSTGGRIAAIVLIITTALMSVARFVV